MFTKACAIILKEDGSNFIECKEVVATHFQMTGMDAILKYGLDTDAENLDLVHSLFLEPKVFFNTWGQVTIAQMKLISDKLWVKDDKIEQHKDEYAHSYVLDELKQITETLIPKWFHYFTTRHAWS